MRNGYRNSFPGIMAVLCAAAIVGCGTPSVKGGDTVMEIAGQAVVKEEYQMVLKSHASEVKSQYTTEEANAEGFWETELEGGKPLAQVMELAKDDLIHKKVVAQLAEEAGISGETDYMSIVGEMEAENADREDKADSGEVVYGLTSFRQEDYYSYVYTNLESQLLESLKASHPVSDEELEGIYQENQEQYTSDVSVQMLVGEMQADAGRSQGQEPEADVSQERQLGTEQGMEQQQGANTGQGQEAAMELAQQVKASMEESADMETLAGQYPEINFYELKMSSLNTEEGKSGAYAQRWMTASVMKEGEVCEPFLIGRNFMVMRCLSREEKAPEPFEDVKGVLKSQVQTSLAQEDIEEKIQRAEVSFQEKILEQAAREALTGT